MNEATAPIEEGQADAPSKEGQAWYDNAPDEVRGYIQNKGWDDPIKAVTSYQELEKFRGASEEQLLKLPKDMTEAGALDEIYSRLGRPDSSEGYSWDAPEGMELDQERMNVAREVAFQIGLNETQFQKLAEMDAEYTNQFMNAYQEQKAAQQEKELASLQKEWGEGFEERVELGRRFVRNNIPEGQDKEQLLNSIEDAIGTANMLKLFANVSDKAGKEDRLPESNGDRPFGYTREQALSDRSQLMAELQGDKERLKVYNEGKGADYEKMKRLNQVISG